MDEIVLSQYSKALIKSLGESALNMPDEEGPRITVSSTVSFLAIVYEKIRNAVEFREEHLIRRAAIERILKRRLSLKPKGEQEAENLIRELLWARYLPSEGVPLKLVETIQKIIDKYIYLKTISVLNRDITVRKPILNFINDLMTCEIEENLNPATSARKMAHLYFFYQVLKNKVEIKGLSAENTDLFFYVASEVSLAKSDRSYLNYHLFKLQYDEVASMELSQIDKIGIKIVEIRKEIWDLIKNPYHEKLSRFAKKHVASFLILFDITDKFAKDIHNILTKKGELWKMVDETCRLKYGETGKKLQRAAIRSIIYIFLTKMIFVIVLEYPLTKYFYGAIHLFPIFVNTIFPPALMGLIVTFVRVPTAQNTKRIYTQIIDILNRDPSFETTKTLVSDKRRVRRPILIFGFTIFYVVTFGITFTLIYLLLNLLRFNIISKLIFVFFVSVVTFFAYRIRQTAKEYNLEDKAGILTPIVDFFFLPILSVGKFLSSEIAKLNIFIWIFDVLIEAPFKLLFEIAEEWIGFIKARKEEIA